MGLDFAANQLGLIAYGSVTSEAGASVMGPVNPVTGQSVPLTRGVIPAGGGGVYTLTFPVPPPGGQGANDQGGVDASESIIFATLRGAAEGSIEVEHTSDTVKTVRTFSGGQPAARDFDFQIWRTGYGRAGAPRSNVAPSVYFY